MIQGAASQVSEVREAPAREVVEGCKLDRRSRRSQRLLLDALADELNAGCDLTRITVAALMMIFIIGRVIYEIKKV